MIMEEEAREQLEEALEEFNDSLDTIEEASESSEDSESSLSEEEREILDRAVEELHQEIPSNSTTLLIDESTSRFSSAIWYQNIQSKTIVIVGVGGIGSWTAFLLARMKPQSMFIYDHDTVELANMSGQFYKESDVGTPKVAALANTIRNYAGYNSVFALSERFDVDSEPSDIVICGLDSMAARKLVFDKWKNHVYSKPQEEQCKCLFIDGRLDAELFQIFCINGDDSFSIAKYEKEFLFSDFAAEESICSYKQTTFCANMIASYMVNLFVNFCANEVGAWRPLPFFTTYSADTMYLKIEE